MTYLILAGGVLGALIGVALCVTGFLTMNEESQTIAIVSAGLTFSSGIYCMMIGAIMFFVFDGMSGFDPAALNLSAALLAGASLISALYRGILTRNSISSNEMNFTRHIVKITLAEVLVLPPLVYNIMLLFVL
jgi:hypothetical protein